MSTARPTSISTTAAPRPDITPGASRSTPMTTPPDEAVIAGLNAVLAVLRRRHPGVAFGMRPREERDNGTVVPTPPGKVVIAFP